VEYYIESIAAYNGVKVTNGKTKRRRSEFTRMLKDIDESAKPVTILTYEDSRLSRNDIDTGEVLSRLFGEYEI
jgi:DNA invertase Pin-like site-specific DNA recombinase